MPLDFFQTAMGNKFYTSDIPKMVNAMNRIADALEKANELKEIELGLKKSEE